MSETYQVLGEGIPTLLGRASQVREITSRIQSNHLQVVGGKYFGKTVLLNGLTTNASIKQAFGEFVFWDLTAHTPKSDAEFWTSFSGQLQNSFSSSRAPYLAKLKGQEQPTYHSFESLFKGLREDKINVLLLLDGMDYVLLPRYITRDLLDNLRDLGQLGSLKFVTASRKTLREISPPEIKTSPFLNLLNTMVRLDAFSEGDWPAFLQPLKEKGFVPEASTVAELTAATGGVPILAAAVCRELIDLPGASVSHPKQISRSDCVSSTQRSESARREIVDVLWRECDAELQATLSDIARSGNVPLDQVPASRVQTLTERGYCRSADNSLVSSCRIMDNYARRNGNVVPDIKRLFGARADYENNIRALLELRLAQLGAIDADLRDYVEMAIRELHKPHVCIAQFRSIADRAMDLIWPFEGDGTNIPPAWARSWKADPQKFKNPFVGRIPADRGDQIFILDKATDYRNGIPVRKVSRSVFHLLSQVHAIGNLGQHNKAATGCQIDLGFMAANCFAAIQLAEQLTITLKS